MSVKFDTHIQNRNGTFYFRIAIPRTLSERIGKTEYKCSLRTNNYRVALKKTRPLAYMVTSFFAEIEKMTVANETLQGLAQTYFEKLLLLAKGTDVAVRNMLNPPESGNPDDPYNFIRLAEHEYADLQKRYKAGDCDIEDEETAKRLMTWQGSEHSYDMRMTNYIKMARLEAKRVELAAMREDMLEMQSKIPLFKDCMNPFIDMGSGVYDLCDLEPYYIKKSSQRCVTTLQDAISRYISFLSANNESADSEPPDQSHLDRLIDFLGADMLVSGLNKKEHGVALRDLVLNLPKNYVQKYKNKGISLPDVLSMAEYEKIAPKNRNFYWQGFNRFFRWCVADGHMASNPLDGVSFKVHKSSKGARLPFSKEQLNTLFSSAIYTGRKNAVRSIWEKGDTVFKDGYYWVPLIGLYTGLRLGEILQLVHGDIKQDDQGVWHIDVNKDGEGKSLKTEGSQRKIPLHSDLIKIGFFDYWRDREKPCRSDNLRLFQDNITYQDGDKIKNYSRQFAAYLKALGIKTPKHVFHSFRHNYVDQIRRMKGVTDEILDALDGRCAGEERSRSTRTLYGTDFTPSDLRPFIEQIDYGLDLSVFLNRP